MKLSLVAFSALAGTATAFAPSSPIVASSASTALRMSAEPLAAEIEEPVAATPSLPAKSQSIPFMARPAALDGSLAGDVGFDPLGFAKTKEDLMNYREAEGE